jgi:hypothetical protein
VAVRRLPSAGEAAFNAETGKGRTPRNGAGSIATVAFATPRPARICASSPPKEVRSRPAPVELARDVLEVVGDLADGLA